MGAKWCWKNKERTEYESERKLSYVPYPTHMAARHFKIVEKYAIINIFNWF